MGNDNAVEVTLQYFDGCPNWKDVEALLTTLSREPGGKINIRRQLVETHEEAEQHRFRGSPTILVNGVDPFAAPEAPIGLTCRIFQTENGPAGAPSIEALRAAIAQTT